MLNKILAAPVRGLIYGYQLFLSPFLRKKCRFWPSCSHYADEAFRTLRFIDACYFVVRRLLKCHPFHEGGIDCVPKPADFKKASKEA